MTPELEFHVCNFGELLRQAYYRDSISDPDATSLVTVATRNSDGTFQPGDWQRWTRTPEFRLFSPSRKPRPARGWPPGSGMLQVVCYVTGGPREAGSS
jgi:hypothetical protein